MKLGVCIPYRDNGDGVRQGHFRHQEIETSPSKEFPDADFVR